MSVMRMRGPTWLLVAVAALAPALAGCFGAQAGPDRVPVEEGPAAVSPVFIDDEGLASGPVDKEWSWDVEPGYQGFRVCITFEGALAPVVVTPHVQLRWDHPDGFEVHGRSNPVALVEPGCWFEHEDGGVGLWTLGLSSQGGTGTWSVRVDVWY